jgi:diacylglycerol kinase
MPDSFDRPQSYQRATSVWQSFRYAFQGFVFALRTQRNLRIHMVIFCVVFALAYWLQVSAVRWGILLVVASLVIMAELFNTAIEVAVDLASPGYHELAKIAKDIAAAGVLVTAFLAFVTGLVVFGPALVYRLTGTNLGF